MGKGFLANRKLAITNYTIIVDFDKYKKIKSYFLCARAGDDPAAGARDGSEMMSQCFKARKASLERRLIP